MKSTNDQININIKLIENEQVPEWVKDNTRWVETKSWEHASGSNDNNVRHAGR